jgi:hypothetical protein
MKKCTKCLLDKELSCFCKCKNNKDGFDRWCRDCKKDYHTKNKDKINKQRRKYELINRDKILAKKRDYTAKTKDQKRVYDIEYRKNNKSKIAKYKKDWAIKNKDKLEYKIVRNLRRRIHHAIKDNYKSDHTITLLGCTIEFFLNYLESMFYEDMNWQNYGSIWHIDHIKPCYTFDLSKEEEQRTCFHYTNQRPLLASENLTRPRPDYYKYKRQNR